MTTISKEANTPGQSKDFAIRTSSEPQPEESRTRGLGNALADPEMDNEKTSRQRVKARISTSTKLPGTDRVSPPLVTPLMDNGAALEEALNNIVDSLGKQNEQMSIRMSELERIEVMKLHFEEEDLSERQECSALTSNLEGTALNCVMAKKQYQRDTAEKIFEILLNRFGSGVQGHQAMMRFEKRRQREDETIDKFLDDLEMLRRRSQPDESNRRMNLAVASKFIDGVKNDELRTMLTVTRNGLCVSVLLNTLDTTVSIQRGKKLRYALPMRTDYEETQNLKKYNVKDCPYHANKDKILKRINELKSIHKLFSMKSETDDGLSSCSNFPERPSSYELDSDKPVLPEIEHLKGKIGEGDFEKLRDVLYRNADVFSKHKADIGCCNFAEREIELEVGAVPHREGARRMTPHKSEACRAEIEMLLEYDIIEPSKSPWACGVVMAKKKGGSLDFVATFVT